MGQDTEAMKKTEKLPLREARKPAKFNTVPSTVSSLCIGITKIIIESI